ncbi:MAG: UvrD-helicase domain-containing protein [Erysipelotrichaceae bacterium]|nr:UvrD-helicase domain-containing protein [Erysipelotrichaceae bacterium]MDY5251288.1 UvrD-helicase domain-containing protein [Erysipelotrichaceae bacterium]
MKFNHEQLAAINTIDTNILVSASAGAGKTSVLVERLMKRCLQDKVSLNKIIALTFTDAAAAEMKKRLSASLNKLYQQDDSDKEYIKQQLVYLSNADITTIDAFCLKIVKKYYYAIGLDPQLADNILDDSLLNNIKKNAFDMALDQALQQAEIATINLLEHFSSRPEDTSSLQNTVMAIINTANTTQDAQAYLDTLLMNAKKIQNLEELPADIYHGFFTFLQTQLSMLENNLNYLASSTPLQEQDDKYLNSINLKRQYLQQLSTYLQQRNYDTFNMEFKNYASKPIKLPTKEFKFEKAIKKKITDREKKILEYLYPKETFIKNHNDLYPIMIDLIDLAKITMQNIYALKQQVKGMDFEDMEHYALAILKANNNLISKQISQNYEEIMVDEFQDTNEIQNEVINLLSNGHNVFRVGDIKQSIYRFRKAKPSLMRDLSHDPNTKQIHLSYNYRSKENIVEFNNCLYDVCMNIEGCEDSYQEADNVKVGVDSQKQIKDYAIKFYALAPIEDIDNKKVKAEFIARKILALKQEDPSSTFKDYVVLLKAHEDKKYLRDAFEKYQVPYNVDAKDNFYESILCMMVISYLKLIIHVDDINLVATLKNIYDVSADQLAQLCKQDILKQLTIMQHPFIDDLFHLRKVYKQDGLISLLDALSLIQNFYEDKLNNKEKTNFDQLYALALKFSQQSNSLEKFIYEIEHGSQTKTKEVTSMDLDEDVVRAITIHQSKGLQYKTVFIWSTSQAKNQESNNEHLIDQDLGLALKPLQQPQRIRQTTIEYLVINEKISKEELEENTRLLYVATTRAQERMYFVDVIKEVPMHKINYEILCERKGISGTILSSIGNNPYIEILGDDAVNQTFATIIPKQNKIVKIDHYHKQDNKKVEIISPSNAHTSALLEIKPTIDHYKHGTTIHEVLENLPLRSWNEEDLAGYDLSLKDQKHLLAFNRSKLFAQTASHQVYREYPFITKDGDKIINGTMDMVMINDDEIIIIDYKTNHQTTADELISLYQEQLQIYKTVMKKNYPKHQIKAYIYAFELEEAILIP